MKYDGIQSDTKTMHSNHNVVCMKLKTSNSSSTGKKIIILVSRVHDT